MSGARLAPLEGWTRVFHGRFATKADGHEWTVDADFLDFDQKLRLYRDGEEVAVHKSPASFAVGEEATIEASMGLLGMERIELVRGGKTTILTPVDGTPEAWRMRLAHEQPELSQAIGVISWIVLIVALITGIGELLGLVGIDSPLDLPKLVATVIGIAALAAAIERALRFKTSRWLG